MSPQATSSGTIEARDIPGASVARLPIYHRVLTQLLDESVATVSSAELAELTGVNSAKVRKDLSHLGSYGVRGVGYDVAYLNYQICRGLGLTNDASVVIIGAGNVGRALASYAGFAQRGFRVVGLFDIEPDHAGRVGTLPVRSVTELELVAGRDRPDIGVIATPADAAQTVCERLVAAGVCSILNFAPTVLAVPDHVEVRQVDLGLELQILAFHAQQRRGEVAGQSTGSALAPAVDGTAQIAVPAVDLRPTSTNTVSA